MEVVVNVSYRGAAPGMGAPASHVCTPQAATTARLRTVASDKKFDPCQRDQVRGRTRRLMAGPIAPFL
jgi:hypothetical protein